MIELEKNTVQTAVEVTEHRQSPRYSFSCDAEVIDIQGNTRIIGRVTDIARRGCYVDCISPFPPGALLAVKIRRGIQTFETTVTEQPHALLLEARLGELSGDKQPELESAGLAPTASLGVVDVQSRNILRDLIRVLRRNRALASPKALPC